MTTATATAAAGTPGRVVTVTTDDGQVWSGVRKNATHGWTRAVSMDDDYIPGFRDYGFSASEDGAVKQAERIAAHSTSASTIEVFRIADPR
jgi:hypothetical protein